jgi:hypothetical protein
MIGALKSVPLGNAVALAHRAMPAGMVCSSWLASSVFDIAFSDHFLSTAKPV